MRKIILLLTLASLIRANPGMKIEAKDLVYRDL